MISTLVSIGRQINCVLVIYTTTKRLTYSCLCLCMLLPKHTVSNRDQCVGIGVMTGKEPTVLSGCMFACENVWDIRANGACAYQCWDSFRGAISAPYTSFVSYALFYHHILSLFILEYNSKWAYRWDAWNWQTSLDPESTTWSGYETLFEI